MPTTVSELFTNANLAFEGPVSWSYPITECGPGAYVVSTSQDPNNHSGILSEPPISIELIEEWIRRVPKIELDGKSHPAASAILNRLAQFWLPDENILYIGMTTAGLQLRVRQYYSTPLGDRRPHAGGHWLKTLSNLSEFFIYHGACEAPRLNEDLLLGYFVSKVSGNTRRSLMDPKHPFPFANLEYPPGTRKRHGIGKSTL